MEKFQLYEDISKRTNGDIYLGVVGPVRVGKSTFISQFMKPTTFANFIANVVYVLVSFTLYKKWVFKK